MCLCILEFYSHKAWWTSINEIDSSHINFFKRNMFSEKTDPHRGHSETKCGVAKYPAERAPLYVLYDRASSSDRKRRLFCNLALICTSLQIEVFVSNLCWISHGESKCWLQIKSVFKSLESLFFLNVSNFTLWFSLLNFTLFLRHF